MSNAKHSQPMQTYCGRVARKPRPDDRFLGFRVALAMSAMGHALPYHWGIGMVRCTPESGPATTRQCETGALRRSVKDK